MIIPSSLDFRETQLHKDEVYDDPKNNEKTINDNRDNHSITIVVLAIYRILRSTFQQTSIHPRNQPMPIYDERRLGAHLQLTANP